VADHGEPRDFEVWVEDDGRTVTVTVTGEVDIATAPELYVALSGGHAREAAAVVVDLLGVTFLDSSGLHALLAANEDLEGRMGVVPSAACLRLFEIAGVTDRFTRSEPIAARRMDR
jgi:anti-anti-sigma factor